MASEETNSITNFIALNSDLLSPIKKLSENGPKTIDPELYAGVGSVSIGGAEIGDLYRQGFKPASVEVQLRIAESFEREADDLERQAAEKRKAAAAIRSTLARDNPPVDYDPSFPVIIPSYLQGDAPFGGIEKA